MKRTTWAVRVACMEGRRGTYRVWCGILRERDKLVIPGDNERIIIKYIFMKWDGNKA